MTIHKIGEIWSKTIRITLKPTIYIAFLLLLLCLGLILAYFFLPELQDNITVSLAIVSLFVMIYAGYYTAISVKLSHTQKRKENSFLVLRDLHKYDTAKIRRLISKIEAETIPPNQICEVINTDVNLDSSIIATFGFWEDISIGIQSGCLDEDLLYYSLSFVIPFHFDKLHIYIEQSRSESRGDSCLYIEMEVLCSAWREHKSLLTGKLYPKYLSEFYRQKGY